MTLRVYLISALVLILLAYIIFRILVRRDYLENGRVSPITLLLETLVCGLYFNFPYIYLPFEWPELPTLPPASLRSFFGIFLVVTGLSYCLGGIFSLGSFRFLGLSSDGLRRSGLYRISRNPQITGIYPAILGFALLWPSWYALGWVGLAVPFFHMMIRTEEEHLTKLYGDEYRKYCDQVPRYLPVLKLPSFFS